MKASDCEYYEYDRRLTGPFINRPDVKVMLGKMLRELTALKDINEATTDQILTWAQRVEAQRAQREVLDHIRKDMEFHSIR